MASLLRFETDESGDLRFEPCAAVVGHLERRHAAAKTVLRSLEASGVLGGKDPTLLSTHPAAHGLVAFKQGFLPPEKAEECVELLAGLDAVRLDRLRHDLRTVHQSSALLPNVETRGEVVNVDLRAPTHAHALDEMLAEVGRVGGGGWEHMVSIVKAITLVIVRGMPDLPYFSGSTSDTWGAIHMSTPSNPVVLAESLTHEAAHLWLHLVEEVGEFAPGAWEENEWISPWREDPRPIGGIIHGVHVFSSAALVLSQWLREGPTTPAGVSREDIEARASFLVAQVEEGITELSRHSGLASTALEIASASETRLSQVRFRIGFDALSCARSRASERRAAKICSLRQKGLSFRH